MTPFRFILAWTVLTAIFLALVTAPNWGAWLDSLGEPQPQKVTRKVTA